MEVIYKLMTAKVNNSYYLKEMICPQKLCFMGAVALLKKYIHPMN